MSFAQWADIIGFGIYFAAGIGVPLYLAISGQGVTTTP